MMGVLPQQRRRLILEHLERAGVVRVAELVHRLEVSESTVRRDLDLLAQRGVLSKVHGGAIAFAAGAPRRQREKEAIARYAATLVPPGSAVALSAGSTTWHTAHHLAAVAGLTVITNSIAVADVFHRHGSPDQTVVLTGGVRTSSDALVGPVGVAAIGLLNVDVLLLGVHGMSLDKGFTTSNLMEAEINRALIAASRRVVVLADHTKWGVVGVSTVALLGGVHTVVVDSGLDDAAQRVLRAHMPELVLV